MTAAWRGPSRRGALGRQALDKAQRLGAQGAARGRSRVDGEASRDVIGRDRDQRAGPFAGDPGSGGVEAEATQRMLAGNGGVFEVAAQPGVRIEREGGGGSAVGLVAGDDALRADGDEL